MAHASAATLSSFLLLGSRPLCRNTPQIPVPRVAGRQRKVSVFTKAVGDGSDSTSSIVKSVKDTWNDSEQRLPLVGLGFSAIVALWASSNLIAAIDKLPLVPNALEFIGILFSWWFIYRYLLFKPDRKELVNIIKSSISQVLGQ